MSGGSFLGKLAVLRRRAEASALAATGRTRRRLDGRSTGVVVLMYHRVLAADAPASDIEPGMFVRDLTFDRQIAWLRERWPVGTLGAAMDRKSASADPPRVALTFDDGWRDNLTSGWPILRRHGVRATVFLVRDWCNAGSSASGEFLRPDEVRALANDGMEFGAHTASHPHLDRLDDAEVERELRLSKEAVEDWTLRKCRFFAYPFGHFREGTVTIARRLFEAAVVVGGGWWSAPGDPWRIPRIGIHEDMTASRPLFEARVAGLL